ncbi:type II secretion system protein [Kineococcus sp. DHX-1]|uniref:type II secretion system protein n=1 Tax=Kineococcus sp. DHX-1 TaxID=3349638 RepID=UPI0036D24EBF
MLARIRKSLDEKDQGFTLIELLVVMIIIGILAAIAIPVFLSQRAKAQDTATKADASTVGKEITSYFVDGSGAPTLAITNGRYLVNGVDAGKASNGVKFNSGTEAAPAEATTFATGTTSDKWCVSFVNLNGSKKTFKYSAQNGLEQGTCSSATAP